MDAIHIPQLTQAPEQTEEITVQEFLPGLETLTPVRGSLRIQHRVNYLEVTGQAEAIITCTCNRCLQQYNHRLAVNAKEIIWLDESAGKEEDLPLEREVAIEDLVETISPNGYFHPGEWLYEQMCLAIPLRQLCDRRCQGIQPVSSDSKNDKPEKPVDKRWASLEVLKNQLPE
ncbi:YceD family protein [Calothrix sp. 336/3]|uniref:YceD family protein n=1 Tax=Calothrix sp. 336/3 TaxID=1337936 RepID=UPI0004E46768|nr:YceD family protein [Calothrix sp. 336/3]AKG24120.1 metal-binding protein [Calothrix sp. 336/3]